MKEEFDLDRFVDAQEPIYERVRSELQRGRKTSHWMWFIFPQIDGLGVSATAQRFAIHSIDEAKAYLDHPLLGLRLRECTDLVIASGSRSADAIFGYPDTLKFRSSMTLFAEAAGQDEERYRKAVEMFFEGAPDGKTMELLKRPDRA